VRRLRCHLAVLFGMYRCIRGPSPSL